MKQILVVISLVTQVFAAFDPERAACTVCLASGDTAGAHAQACCNDHYLCCKPSVITNNPWGHSYAPGVCDENKCDKACDDLYKNPVSKCDREVNHCDCFNKNGQCVNCGSKPGKCDAAKCNKDCASPGEHPLAVKGNCNRANNYCECLDATGRCRNC